VRRAAVQTLSTAAHVKPGLLGGQLAGLLPALYAQTVVDPSLIRTVDLGPFKHKIDDGLELRKVLLHCSPTAVTPLYVLVHHRNHVAACFA